MTDYFPGASKGAQWCTNLRNYDFMPSTEIHTWPTLTCRTSRILCKALCSLSLGKGFSDGADWCGQAWMGKPLTPWTVGRASRILSKFHNLLGTCHISLVHIP